MANSPSPWCVPRGEHQVACIPWETGRPHTPQRGRHPNRVTPRARCAAQRPAACFWIADLRLAAWFLWMTPADAALSSLRVASCASTRARSASPEAAASRKWRTAVLSADFTDLLRSCAFLFCRLRLIWDLMFATGRPQGLVRQELGVRGVPRTGATAHSSNGEEGPQIDAPGPA